MVSDKYYGRRDIAMLCERTLNTFFQKSKATTPIQQYASSSTSKPLNVPQIREWVAYILYRTALPNSTVFHALHLLRRLSANFACDPNIPSPPLFHHRLIVACLVLATDWSMDDAYSKKSWSIACRQVFTLEELNEMEISLLRSLDWKLRLEGEDLDQVVQGMEAEWREELKWEEEERRRWKEIQRRQKEMELRQVKMENLNWGHSLKEKRRQSGDSIRTIRPSHSHSHSWGEGYQVLQPAM